jgi:tryptophan synthase alpha subunit
VRRDRAMTQALCHQIQLRYGVEMSNQQSNEPRTFKVALIYMVEERTQEKIAELYQQLQASGIEVFLFSKDMPTVESHEGEMHKKIQHASEWTSRARLFSPRSY